MDFSYKMTKKILSVLAQAGETVSTKDFETSSFALATIAEFVPQGLKLKNEGNFTFLELALMYAPKCDLNVFNFEPRKEDVERLLLKCFVPKGEGMVRGVQYIIENFNVSNVDADKVFGGFTARWINNEVANRYYPQMANLLKKSGLVPTQKPDDIQVIKECLANRIFSPELDASAD